MLSVVFQVPVSGWIINNLQNLTFLHDFFQFGLQGSQPVLYSSDGGRAHVLLVSVPTPADPGWSPESSHMCRRSDIHLQSRQESLWSNAPKPSPERTAPVTVGPVRSGWVLHHIFTRGAMSYSGLLIENHSRRTRTKTADMFTLIFVLTLVWLKIRTIFCSKSFFCCFRYIIRDLHVTVILSEAHKNNDFSCIDLSGVKHDAMGFVCLPVHHHHPVHHHPAVPTVILFIQDSFHIKGNGRLVIRTESFADLLSIFRNLPSCPCSSLWLAAGLEKPYKTSEHVQLLWSLGWNPSASSTNKLLKYNLYLPICCQVGEKVQFPVQLSQHRLFLRDQYQRHVGDWGGRSAGAKPAATERLFIMELMLFSLNVSTPSLKCHSISFTSQAIFHFCLNSKARRSLDPFHLWRICRDIGPTEVSLTEPAP